MAKTPSRKKSASKKAAPDGDASRFVVTAGGREIGRAPSFEAAHMIVKKHNFGPVDSPVIQDTMAKVGAVCIWIMTPGGAWQPTGKLRTNGLRHPPSYSV
jgi:hypothetical protein